METQEHHLPAGHLLQNGNYTIIRVLGEGGFGITYEAHNHSNRLHPKVAIKEFFMKGCVRGEGQTVKSQSIQTSDFEKFRDSFIKEAEMIDRFRHPGIVEVMAVFEENNTAYMVMKFVAGKTLKQEVEERGALPKEEALGYLHQLCKALVVVHAQNAVHRDIAPDNIILTPDGRTVLIDFGAAKQYLAEHTQSSVGLVKDGFSPREQYSLSSKKGPFSDVYAVGALGYYLLTAERPMPAIDRYDAPDWQPVTGHAEVDQVLAKAMAMQPGERYPDARVLQEALRDEPPRPPSKESGQTYKHTKKPPPDPPIKSKPNEATPTREGLQPSPPNKMGWIVGSVVVLVLVAWGVGLFQGQSPGGKDVPWPEMVYVEGGSFQMGSNDGEDDEKPLHSVELSSFYMGKTEVTQAQWRRVMGSDPPELRFKGCAECPVENVSWNDIQEFLQKLNGMTGQTYRLPTEAEWEYAARGGNESRGYTYAGSNDLDEVAWYDSNSGDKTHPVAGKKPNELGLYDMSGNVWEWCADWYGSDYYGSSPRKDPQGPATGSYRVVRGGSWNYFENLSRVANRNRYNPDNRSYYFGFRLCRDL